VRLDVCVAAETGVHLLRDAAARLFDDGKAVPLDG
jgi:hypothetical protein